MRSIYLIYSFLKDYIPHLILSFFLIIGVSAYSDYGIAWDEEAQMKMIGKAAYDFIRTNDSETYIKNPEKYHGPAFEVFLYTLQKLFNKTEPPDSYYFRHLIMFLLFWSTGVAFFTFLRKYFKNIFIVSIGIAWYFMMPRFFAESFYNTKDISFYCFTIFSLISLFNFIEKRNLQSALLHALICGIAIGIRITGIIFPIVSLFIFFITLLSYRKGNSFNIPLLKNGFIAFPILLIASMIIFWPVLWMEPIYHFSQAFIEMSKFPWQNNMRYLGEFISTLDIPWHYSIVWILISTPELYLIFMVIGTLFTIYSLIVTRFKNISSSVCELYSICVLLISISLIIILNSVIYDGWRHLYYLYAPILILSLKGVSITLQKPYNLKLPVPAIIKSTIVIYTIYIGFIMIKIHPYQNIYFNYTSGLNSLNHNFEFELDYWGLSYRRAIENLLLKDNRKMVKMNFSNDAGRLNLNILTTKQKERIIITDLEGADYHITNYRWADRRIHDKISVDSIIVNNLIISETFKLKEQN